MPIFRALYIILFLRQKLTLTQQLKHGGSAQ
jgi:hypothetical protein